ncbi:hypothetical protein F5884DRAFT_769088 [Xylogone sp. PMI_703]|nr:hypothetical protein F5884DRAFT_769088 [Xylogone sp. PMI_703]
MYTAINDSDIEGNRTVRPRLLRHWGIWLCVLAILANNVIFYFLGSQSSLIWSSQLWDPPNAIFTQIPLKDNVWFSDEIQDFASVRTVEIRHPSKHNLAGGWPLPSEEFPEREAYGVSAFHQLHCLVSLKREISGLVGALEKSSQGVFTPLDNVHDAGHTAHCVNFLVQAIKCTSDLTLVPVKVANNTLINDFDAYGASRRCRDWNRVHELAVQYGADHFF